MNYIKYCTPLQCLFYYPRFNIRFTNIYHLIYVYIYGIIRYKQQREDIRYGITRT